VKVCVVLLLATLANCTPVVTAVLQPPPKDNSTTPNPYTPLISRDVAADFKWHVHLFDVPGSSSPSTNISWLHCGIPKVGCTEFWKLMWRLAGDAKWDSASPHFASLHPGSYDAAANVQLASLSPPLLDDRVRRIVHRSVFFRDPLERLLSAYLDKLASNSYVYNYMHIDGQVPHNRFSWDHFLREFIAAHRDAARGQKPASPVAAVLLSDPHFVSQLDVCSLRSTLPMYNFIGYIDEAAHDARLLLDRLGLWEQFGRTGYGARGEWGFFETQLPGRADGRSRVYSKSKFLDYYNVSIIEELLSLPLMAEQVRFMWETMLYDRHPIVDVSFTLTARRTSDVAAQAAEAAAAPPTRKRGDPTANDLDAFLASLPARYAAGGPDAVWT